MAHLVIGTRSDRLAIRQASFIKTQIEKAHVGLQVALEILVEKPGDWLNEASLALHSRRVDAVVHHLCDLSPHLPENLHLAALVERTDARDALVVSAALRGTVPTLTDLPAPARVIATGGHRRVQIVAQAPDVLFVGDDIPLESALQKLSANEIDALVTDAFSLWLMQAQDQIAAWLAFNEFIPAAGQGILTLQSRLEDQRTNLILESLNHHATRLVANAERAALRNLYGESGDAIAVTAQITESERTLQLTLWGLVGDASLAKPVQIARGKVTGDASSPELLGSTLAVQLLNDGARALLNHTRSGPFIVKHNNELASDDSGSLQFLNDKTNLPEDIATVSPLRQAASAFQGAGSQAALADSPYPTHIRNVNAFAEDTFPEFDLVASKVQRLRQQQPLQAKRILLAYAGRKYDGLAQQLEALGASVFTLPKFNVAAPVSCELLDKLLVHISWYDCLVFSNSVSVTTFLERATALGLGLGELEARRLCAIGPATAHSLEAAGLIPDLVLPQFNAQKLSLEWEKYFGQREPLRGKTMLWLTSENSAHEFTHTTRLPLRAGFDQLGVYVEAVPAFRYAASQEPGGNMAFDYALFFDATSFENLSALCAPQRPVEALHSTRIVCFSSTARTAALEHGFPASLHISATTIAEIVKWLREDVSHRFAVKTSA